MANTTNPPVQQAPADAQSAGKAAPAPPPVPFVRAALPKVMRSKQYRQQVTLSTSDQPLPTLTIPAHGFLRRVILKVSIDQMTGGTYSLDGLAAAIKSVNFADTNGSDIIVPVSGPDLKLLNKWVPSGGYSDPAIVQDPDGLSVYLILAPEISQRDGLGALPNMDQSSLYSSDITVGKLADVFTVNPGTAPVVTVEAFVEAWSPPQPSDFGGRPVEPQPPALNTTQYVSKHRKTVAVGNDNMTLERRGNLVRALLLVGRNTSGVRSDSVLPESFRFVWDGREMFDMDTDLQRFFMRERGGMPVDTGVLLLDFTHEFDGRLGAELRDQWLRTLKSSTIELDMSTIGAAGQLSILTVDVAPAGNVYVS